MKKRILAMVLGCAMAATVLAGCGGQSTDQKEAGKNTSATEEAADGKVYKVGIVQYVDDASLNQIVKAVKEELDAKGKELGVTFDYDGHTYNGQADATVMNQIASDLINDGVDAIVPVATPVAMVMQAATEETQTPVVFSAVSDPVITGLVDSMEKPGSNITGTSDMLDTEAILDLMLAAQPDIKKVGLLYDKGQDSSTQPIADAKKYLEAKGIECVEKTGTTNDKKDGWFCGFTRYYTTCVWVGCDMPETVKKLTGSSYPAEIWKNYMDQIHADLTPIDFLPYAQISDDYQDSQETQDTPADDQTQNNPTDQTVTTPDAGTKAPDKTTTDPNKTDAAGGNTGGNTGDNNGGNTGGNTGENNGGNTGGNTGENNGGNTGGNTGDNTGGATGGTTGGGAQ